MFFWQWVSKDISTLGGYSYQICGNSGTIICRTLISSMTTVCLKVASIKELGPNLVPINQDEVYISGYSRSGGEENLMKRINFTTNSAIWEKSQTCPFSSCIYAMSSGEYIPSENSVYSSQTYSNVKTAILLEIDLITGDFKTGSQISIFTECSGIWRMAQAGDYVYTMIHCTPGGVYIQYDINQKTVVTIHQSVRGAVYDFIILPKSNAPFEDKHLIILGGDYYPTNAMLISADFENLGFHSDFREGHSIAYHKEALANATFQIQNGPIDTIISVSGTITSAMLPAPINEARIMDPGFVYSTKVLHNISAETFYLVENSQGYVTPNFTKSCDSSDVSLTLASNNGASIPSWIQLDAANGKINYTSPEFSSISFSFVIETLVEGWVSPRNKIIHLNIGQCNIDRCLKCHSNNFGRCEKCEPYHQGDNCEKKSYTLSKTASVIGVALPAVSAALILISSTISLQSPFIVWILINHLQLLFFLLLTNSFFPNEIIELITNSNFALFNFDFLYSTENVHFGRFIKWAETDQPNPILKRIGFNYGSSFRNNISFFFILITLLPIHLLSYLLTLIPINPQKSKFKRFLKYLITNFYHLMTFNIYLRLLLESFFSLNLTSTFEISYSNPLRPTPSLCISVVIICILILFCVGIFLCGLRVGNGEFSKVKEIFVGLKERKGCLGYAGVWVSRRFIFVGVVSGLRNVSEYYLLGSICFIETFYLSYLLFFRPFKQIRVNLIEIINEAFFSIYSFSLLFLTEETWNDDIVDITITLFMANNIIITIIVSVCAIYDIIKKLTFLKAKKKKVIQPKRTITVPSRRGREIESSAMGLQKSKILLNNKKVVFKRHHGGRISFIRRSNN